MKMKVIDTIKWGLMEPKPTMQATYVSILTLEIYEVLKMLQAYETAFEKVCSTKDHICSIGLWQYLCSSELGAS